MKKLILFPGVALFILTCGCFLKGTRGNGIITTESRSVAAYRELLIEGVFQVEWSTGPASVSVTADQNIIPLIATDVEGNKLHIHPTHPMTPTRMMTVTISGPSFPPANLIGKIDMNAQSITGDLCQIVAAGSVHVTASGAVKTLNIHLTGASKVDALGLAAQLADVQLVGACEASVHAVDTLNTSIVGAGILSYSGNPKIGDRNLTTGAVIKQVK